MLEKSFCQPRFETIESLGLAPSGTPLALRQIAGHRVETAMHQLCNPMRRMALPVQSQHRIHLFLSLHGSRDLPVVCHRQDGIGHFLAHNISLKLNGQYIFSLPPYLDRQFLCRLTDVALRASVQIETLGASDCERQVRDVTPLEFVLAFTDGPEWRNSQPAVALLQQQEV